LGAHFANALPADLFNGQFDMVDLNFIAGRWHPSDMLKM